MKLLQILTVACLIAVAARSLDAAQLKVPKQFPTIQAAVDAALMGDVVVVSKGTYAPFVISMKDDLTVRGKGKVVIDATGATCGITVGVASDIVLRDLWVINAKEHGISILVAQAEVRSCRIEGVGGHGIVAAGAAGSLFVKNRISYVGGCGLNVNAAGALLKGNRIKACHAEGIRFVGNEGTIQNNRIEDASEYGIFVGDPEAPAHDTLVMGNIVKDIEGSGIGIWHADGFSMLENLISQSTKTGLAMAENDSGLCRENRSYSAGFRGIFVNCHGIDIVKNKVKKSANHGICDYYEAYFNQYVRNRISKAGQDGFMVEGNGGVYKRNRVTKSAEHGFNVYGDLNHFVRNVAKKSGGLNLFDHHYGENTYVDNVF